MTGPWARGGRPAATLAAAEESVHISRHLELLGGKEPSASHAPYIPLLLTVSFPFKAL